MAQCYTSRVTLRAGATPQTFDGAGTFRFNEKAQKLVALILGHSISVYTTDEGFAMAVQLSKNAGLSGQTPVFFMGMTSPAGPATNTAVKHAPQDVLFLDIDIAPSSTMQIDISTVAGATQTGTHDVEITAVYADGDLDSEQKMAFIAASGSLGAKGGSYGYTTALATTTETALTGNGTTLNIPAAAREIIGFVALFIVDTAVSQSEELGGHVRLQLGLENQGEIEIPLSGGIPNLGTEVEGGAVAMIKRLPYFIPDLPGRELNVSAYASLLSTITGGADVAFNILWR